MYIRFISIFIHPCKLYLTVLQLFHLYLYLSICTLHTFPLTIYSSVFCFSLYLSVNTRTFHADLPVLTLHFVPSVNILPFVSLFIRLKTTPLLLRLFVNSQLFIRTASSTTPPSICSKLYLSSISMSELCLSFI